MGFIHDDHGRISIETRRESFIIHADYGYRPATKMARYLMPGNTFYFDGEDPEDLHNVESISQTHMKVRNLSMVGLIDIPRDDRLTVPCYPTGGALDVEEDPDHPLGVWQEHSHPEFDNKDFQSLRDALDDVADTIKAKT